MEWEIFYSRPHPGKYSRNQLPSLHLLTSVCCARLCTCVRGDYTQRYADFNHIISERYPVCNIFSFGWQWFGNTSPDGNKRCDKCFPSKEKRSTKRKLLVSWLFAIIWSPSIRNTKTKMQKLKEKNAIFSFQMSFCFLSFFRDILRAEVLTWQLQPLPPRVTVSPHVCKTES